MSRCYRWFFVVLLSAPWVSPAPAAEKPGWQTEWERTVEAAKREGQVTIYAFAGGPLLPIEAGVFQKRFPEIKVVAVSGDPVPRALAERRAARYLADVVIGGSSTPWQMYLAKALDPIKDAMILPEVTDESKWWRGRHHYRDPEKRFALVFIGNPDFGSVFYNSSLVKPKEIQSLWDLLNPKWKGRIAARDVRIPGGGGTSVKMFYHHPGLGPPFIRRLFGETDITLFRDRRQGVDWLATGRFPLCLFCSRTDVGRAKGQGLPVDEFGPLKEGAGVTSSGGNIGLVNRAPHPNAARVFINWFLSREGQATLQTEYAKVRGGYSNSLRVDISKEMIPPEQRLKEDIHYVDVEVPEQMSMEPVLKVFNEALAKTGK